MKLHDLLGLNTVIQCNARTDMEKVFTIFDELGLKWSTGTSYTDWFITEVNSRTNVLDPYAGKYGSAEYYTKQGVDILSSDEFIINYSKQKYKQKKMEESKKTGQSNKHIRVEEHDSSLSVAIKGNITELAALLASAADESVVVKTVVLLAAAAVAHDDGKHKLSNKLTQLAIDETIKSFT